jgi:hypothetical protein
MFHPNEECPCSTEDLQLWNKKAVQVEVEDGQFEEKAPITTNENATTHEFRIPADGERYTDMKNSFIEVEIQIVKEDGTDTGADDDVSLVNNAMHSIFQQAVLSLNETDVTSSNSTYHLRAYMEILLSFGPEAAKSQLGCIGWETDKAGHFDDAAAANPAYVKRKAWTSAGKKRTFMGKLRLSLFDASELIPNGVDIKLKLTKSKDAILLQQPVANTDVYKTKITKIAFHVRRVKLSPTTLLEHAKHFRSLGPAIIPIRTSELKTYVIGAGLRNQKIENLCQGKLPDLMVVGMVTNKAYNGNKKDTFYNFKHFDLRYMQVQRDGIQYPSTPFKPCFDEGGNNLRGYHSLFHATGKLNNDEGLCFNRDEYGKGYTLYAFNFTPDLNDGGMSQLHRKGDLNIELSFGTALAEAVNVVILFVHDQTVKINETRAVLLDYIP